MMAITYIMRFIIFLLAFLSSALATPVPSVVGIAEERKVMVDAVPEAVDHENPFIIPFEDSYVACIHNADRNCVPATDTLPTHDGSSLGAAGHAAFKRMIGQRQSPAQSPTTSDALDSEVASLTAVVVGVINGVVNGIKNGAGAAMGANGSAGTGAGAGGNNGGGNDVDSG